MTCEEENSVRFGVEGLYVQVCQRGGGGEDSAALNWRVICDSDWTVEDARVACRSLNLPSEGTYVYSYMCV